MATRRWGGPAATGQLWLFAVTMFMGAALVFWVQPLFTKMVLPLLGGTPSVWNAAMVFFQAALLCGYGYAHLLTSRLGPRGQCLAHFALLCAAAVCLPIGIAEGWRPDPDAPPALWVLGLFAVSIGAPFVAVAATAPLVQRWFSRTDHARASDPYFLYAASNLGSVAVLLAFPFLIEPRLGTNGQAWAWTLGFAVLTVCVVACGASAWRREIYAPPKGGLGGTAARPTWRQRAVWLAYAAIPSSLLLAVTGHISTDIASAPLLWVVPLALYLLSFVNAFARRPLIPSWVAGRAMAFGLVLLATLFVRREPTGLILPLHLVVFFLVATACHARLVERRPDPAFLTEFYLLLAFGGLIGGVSVALLAPLAFDSVLEYPLILVLGAALLPRRKTEREPLWRAGDAAIAALILAVLVGGRSVAVWAGLPVPLVVFGGILGILAVFALSRQVRPLGFALCIAALLMAGHWPSERDETLWSGRTFFGVYRVVDSPDPPRRSLHHGTTNHGGQWTRRDGTIGPTTYFTPASPAARVIAATQDATQSQRVGLVGLGTGALAYYRRPQDAWRYFEIDPMIAWLAAESGYFHILPAYDPSAAIVLGDARLTLEREPDRSFDLLIIDVFSSDAIPMHLMTREAIALYMQKLDERGVLLLHTSNRLLDLRPVVAGAVSDLGLAAMFGRLGRTASEADRVSAPSEWVAVMRSRAMLNEVGLDVAWAPLDPPTTLVWRDDFSNLAAVIRWRISIGD